MRKLTYIEIKNFIEIDSNSGCKLISTKYTNTNSKLDMVCSCGETFTTTFKHFKTNHQRQCRKCSNAKLSSKFTKTHEQFCKEIYDLVGCEYEILSEYQSYHKHISIKHISCNHIYNVTPANFISGYRCPKCNGGVKSDIHEFKNKLFQKYGTEYEVIGEYVNSSTKIRIKHNICGEELMIRPNDILSGNKCIKCAGLERKTLDKVKNEIFNLVNDEYEVDGEYKNNKSKLLFTHKICGKSFLMRYNNFLNGQRCPICEESKGEQLIRIYLETHNISFESQKEFKELVGLNNGNLSYDFYIPKHNLLIEYQGEQHEKYIEGFHKSKQDFEKQQEHDRRKFRYAKINNIKLLEIWYWDFDKIEEILDKETT